MAFFETNMERAQTLAAELDRQLGKFEDSIRESANFADDREFTKAFNRLRNYCQTAAMEALAVKRSVNRQKQIENKLLALKKCAVK